MINSSDEDEDELDELELEEDDEDEERSPSGPPSAATSSGPMMSANISDGNCVLLVLGTSVGIPFTAGAGLC